MASMRPVILVVVPSHRPLVRPSTSPQARRCDWCKEYGRWVRIEAGGGADGWVEAKRVAPLGGKRSRS